MKNEEYECMGCGECFSDEDVMFIDGDTICKNCEKEYWVYRDNI